MKNKKIKFILIKKLVSSRTFDTSPSNKLVLS